MALSRREILKGMSLSAGGALLSPIMSQIQADAAGVTNRKQRFVFIVEGNGLPWDQIQPEGIARGSQYRHI